MTDIGPSASILINFLEFVMFSCLNQPSSMRYIMKLKEKQTMELFSFLNKWTVFSY